MVKKKVFKAGFEFKLHGEAWKLWICALGCGRQLRPRVLHDAISDDITMAGNLIGSNFKVLLNPHSNE